MKSAANYAPDHITEGNVAARDFVGWGGVPPIAVFFEYVIGLQANVPNNRIVWNVNLLEEHGAKNYPFGAKGTLDLLCKACWSGGRQTIKVEPS